MACARMRIESAWLRRSELMMMRRAILTQCVLALLLAAVASPAGAGTNIWTSTGPNGGPIRSILIDPATPTTVYAGTLGAGVFVSTDSGTTWTPRGLAGLTVRALVRKAGSPATLYAGVENDPGAASGGVFSSQDGGANWTPLDTGLTNKKVQALVLDAGTLYAGTDGGGVFVWDGATWTAVNSGLAPAPGDCTACPLKILALAADSRAPGTIYAGTEGTGVYKSGDGGVR